VLKLEFDFMHSRTWKEPPAR